MGVKQRGGMCCAVSIAIVYILHSNSNTVAANTILIAQNASVRPMGGRHASSDVRTAVLPSSFDSDHATDLLLCRTMTS